MMNNRDHKIITIELVQVVGSGSTQALFVNGIRKDCPDPKDLITLNCEDIFREVMGSVVRTHDLISSTSSAVEHTSRTRYIFKRPD